MGAEPGYPTFCIQPVAILYSDAGQSIALPALQSFHAVRQSPPFEHRLRLRRRSSGDIVKILFADKFQSAYLDQLKAVGHDCDSQPDLSADDLPAHIGGVEILIVRSTRVTRAALAAADSLKMVIRAGAGTNTIDKAAATEKNIPVCNVPGKNALAVAELAFALLLCIDRNIPDQVSDLRQGQWDKKKYSKAQGIYGRNLGIVGLGEIGMAFAERAAAFGMQINVIAKTQSRRRHECSLVGAQSHRSGRFKYPG